MKSKDEQRGVSRVEACWRKSRRILNFWWTKNGNWIVTTNSFYFVGFFGFFLPVALAIIMENRISNAKNKRLTGKRSFSKGKHLTNVPISELLSTYLHIMWILRLCQKSRLLWTSSLCQKRGGHKAFWHNSAFLLNKGRRESLFSDRLVLVSMINWYKNFAVVPKLFLLFFMWIK